MGIKNRKQKEISPNKMRKYYFWFFGLSVIFLGFIFLLFYNINQVKDNKYLNFELSNAANSNLNLFTKDKKNENNNDSFTLISTGDIGLVRDVNYKINKYKNPNYPFEKIAEYTRNADLTITNLEGPLINNCPIILEGFTFCGDSINVAGLTYAGIDAASVANNHTTNYGVDGLSQTSNILEENNIYVFGLDNQIKYIDVKGKKIALLGFVELGNNWEGLNNATIKNVSELNKIAKENAEIVINTFHWGNEYTYNPTEYQILIARTAIDNGADLILGNHPHWIQPIDLYKDKYIIYAQGNTIFDQDWSQETKEGVLYKFIFRNGRFEKVDEKFTIIENNSQPRFASREESEKIKKKVLGR